MSHTPGPWRAHRPGEWDDPSEYWQIDDEYGHTATVYGDSAEAEANARLVAAAPEMLKTLRFIVETMYAAAHATPRYDSVGVNILLEAADEVRRAIRTAEEGRE